jgi:lipopolysaccharide transport system ATP-binding protein
MNEVEQFCDHAILLHNGILEYNGAAIEAVKRYYFIQQNTASKSEQTPVPETARTDGFENQFPWPGKESMLDISDLSQVSDGRAVCTAVALCDVNGQPCLAFEQGQTASFFFEFESLEEIGVPIGGAEIVDRKGNIIHGKNSLLYGSRSPTSVVKHGRVRFRQAITLNIQPGEYTFNVGFSTIPLGDWQKSKDLPHQVLDERISVLNILPGAGSFTILHRSEGDPVQLMHFGLADLPGDCQIMVAIKPTREEKDS